MPRRSVPLASVALVSVAAVALAGCAAGSNAADAESTTATIGLVDEPANLDFTTTDGAAIPEALLDNVYEGLVTLDDSGDIQPLLAESWEVSDDNRTYTFELAEGVTFSNGDPFTAETVAWNIENVQSDAWTISLKSYMDVVESVEVVDGDTVAVTLAAPSNDWLFRMTTRVGAMFSPTGSDNLATETVGTGPYAVSEFNIGDSLVLSLRDDYWGDAPALEEVTFRYFGDANALNSALLSGGIDAIYALPVLDTLDQFSDASRFTVVEGGTNAEVTLSLNNASGIFSDVRVRRAVWHAIDRETIVANATAGAGQLLGSMVPSTDPWYDESLVDAYEYDPELARELLAEAGVEGATVRFRVPNLSNISAAAQLVQSDLTAVGLNVQIDSLEFPAQWLEQVFTGHDFDMSIINHVEARDFATYADPTYYWGYDSPEFQELVALADSGTAEEQVDYLREATTLLNTDAVSVWLYLEPQVSVTAAGLVGLPTNALGESLNLTELRWE